MRIMPESYYLIIIYYWTALRFLLRVPGVGTAGRTLAAVRKSVMAANKDGRDFANVLEADLSTMTLTTILRCAAADRTTSAAYE
jgi:hypothetical protein